MVDSFRSNNSPRRGGDHEAQGAQRTSLAIPTPAAKIFPVRELRVQSNDTTIFAMAAKIELAYVLMTVLHIVHSEGSRFP